MSHPQPPRSGAGPKPTKHTPIPTEWRIELPEQGANWDAEFGGCRSIEEGYRRDRVLGQGTYGEVYLAFDRATGDRVAAKKIKMDNEKEGFPITAIREIKILSALAGAKETLPDGMLLRNNIIGLREIVRSSSHKANNFKGSIYMIFDYMDHDMTGLLERTQREGKRFTPAQIKCYLKQLFCGLWLLDQRNILHRDLKNANLLVNNKGELKIADFGLARYYTKPEKSEEKKEGVEQPPDSRMTNRVITLWYRPPELFLGADHYGTEIDTWSAGCIMFELLTGKPLFPGKDEADQLEKIFSIMGQPNEHTMPGCTSYPNYNSVLGGGLVNRFPRMSRLRQHCESRGVTDPHALDLLEQLLKLSPAARINAQAAALHNYFFKDPMPAKPHEMPTFESSHEMGMKRVRQEQRYGGGGGQRGGQHHGGQQRGGQQQGQQGSHYHQQQQQQQGAPPPAQRQRTQGQYTGPQQQPYRGGMAGQQPYRGGGGGAPAAGTMGGGGMRMPGGSGAGAAPAGIVPGRVVTQEQLQQMMSTGVVAPVGVVPHGLLQPQQGAGAYGYGAQSGRAGGAPVGSAHGPGGMQAPRFGGAPPSWERQKR